TNPQIRKQRKTNQSEEWHAHTSPPRGAHIAAASPATSSSSTPLVSSCPDPGGAARLQQSVGKHEWVEKEVIFSLA
uniref:Uncharacterized protein n=1 Tax=Aegilops tauschii subsp. strangulata TaxID=200361 RepID=A0A453HVK2_AEGTS